MVALPRLYGKGPRLYGVNAVQFKLGASIMENIPPQQSVKGGDVTVSGGNAGPHGKGGDFTMIGGTIKGGDAVSNLIASAPIKKSFWYHPLMRPVLYVVGGLILAAILIFVGFK